jgi:hypothetical protein
MFYHPDCDPQKMEIDWHALLMAGGRHVRILSQDPPRYPIHVAN